MKPLSRAWAYSLAYAYVMGGYMLTNHTSGWSPPHALPLLAIDRLAPFWPWTGWIYLTVFPFPLLAVFHLREERDVRALIKAFLACATTCFAFFYFYPTVYPRPAFNGSGPLDWPMMLVHLVDTAGNCWPSMHVTAAFLTALFVRRLRPEWGAFLLFWACAISASTLTTKQHYSLDVLAGAALAWTAYKAFNKA